MNIIDILNRLLTAANSWGVVFVLLLILGMILLFIIPWGQRWRCQECDAVFEDRKSALRHQAVHALHRPVQEQ